MNELSLMISITQILEENQCSYNDVEKILKDIIGHYKTVRECLEYETVDDYIKGIKKVDIGNQVVRRIPDIRPEIEKIGQQLAKKMLDGTSEIQI